MLHGKGLMKGGIYLLILITIVLALGAGSGQAKMGSRRNYGSSTPPFWYPLTAFEQETLLMAGEKNRADQEVLLRLALMASGVRDRHAYQSYLGKIEAFWSEVGAELQRSNDSLVKGRLLLEKMHRAFLLPASEHGRPVGYSMDQSSLTVLLDTGKFNCTSSAMLYTILAGYVGLEVQGATMPNHVFIELKTGNNSWVAIETTSSNGFAIAHNREFYREQAATWQSWRGRQPGTYLEYQQRKPITPTELMAMNMDDQHVGQMGMGEEDRLRLREAQMAVMAGDRFSQLMRLGLYSNEFNLLSSRGDYDSLVRMFDLVKPVLRDIYRRWPEDLKVAKILSWLSYQQARSLYQTGVGDEAIALMEESLELDRKSRQNADLVLNNNLNLLHDMVNDQLEEGVFADALDLCDRFSFYFQEESSFPDLYRMIYAHWSNYYGWRQEWDAAIAVLNEELTFLPGDAGESGARLRNQMAGYYLNRGVKAFNSRDWQRAIELYEEGFAWAEVNTPARLPEFRHKIAASYQGRARSSFGLEDWPQAADDFAEQLAWELDPAAQQVVETNIGAAYINWKNAYLNQGDYAGAAAVMAECISRFPWLGDCREPLR